MHLYIYMTCLTQTKLSCVQGTGGDSNPCRLVERPSLYTYHYHHKTKQQLHSSHSRPSELKPYTTHLQHNSLQKKIYIYICTFFFKGVGGGRDTREKKATSSFNFAPSINVNQFNPESNMVCFFAGERGGGGGGGGIHCNCSLQNLRFI